MTRLSAVNTIRPIAWGPWGGGNGLPSGSCAMPPTSRQVPTMSGIIPLLHYCQHGRIR